MTIKNNGILIKKDKEVKIMAEGGSKLAKVKAHLKKLVKEGVNASQVENLADTLIRKEGGMSSFKMVPGYSWATCVNVNEGVVHGIPSAGIVFKQGDVVSVDVGMFYKGFHTDTSFSVDINADKKTKKFLAVGKSALESAIKSAVAGARIYDISLAIETVLLKNKFSPIKALVGHGVGRDLHEQPQIPCFTSGERKNSPEINPGAVLAIEVMYSEGSGDIRLSQDGWTIATSDGKIAALFEETVAVLRNGNIVLTEPKLDLDQGLKS